MGHYPAPGLRTRGPVQRSGVRLDHDLTEAAPPAWGDTIETVLVPGGLGFHEVALFHRPSATLVLTDLAMRLEADKVPSLLRPLLRLSGMLDGMPPPYLRAVVKLRRATASRAARRLLQLRPERVLFAHGKWFDGDGTATLRRSLHWLLPVSADRGDVGSRIDAGHRIRATREGV